MLYKITLALALLTLPSVGEAKFISDYQVLNHLRNLDYHDRIWILSIIKAESGNDSSKKILDNNDRYSYGLMQVQLPTARMLGFKGPGRDLLKWRTNIKYGVKYLKWQEQRYGGRRRDGLAAYNAGSLYICRTGKTVSGNPCRIGLPTNEGHLRKVREHYFKLILQYSPAPLPKGYRNGSHLKQKRLALPSPTSNLA